MRPGDEAMIATYNRSMKVRVPFTRDAEPDQVDARRARRASPASASPTAASASRPRTASARPRPTTTPSPPPAPYASLGRARPAAERRLDQRAHDHAGRRRGKEDPRPHQRRLPDAARPRDVLLHRRDRPREGLAERRLDDARGHDLRRHEPDPVGRQDRQRERHHACTPSTRPASPAARRCPPSTRARSPASVSQAAPSNTTESMQLMADMTGGLASVQTNNFAAAFEQDPAATSSPTTPSATAPAPSASTASATCSVRVKNKDYRVRNRQTFVEKSMLRGDERPRRRQPALPRQGQRPRHPRPRRHAAADRGRLLPRAGRHPDPDAVAHAPAAGRDRVRGRLRRLRGRGEQGQRHVRRRPQVAPGPRPGGAVQGARAASSTRTRWSC